MQRSRFTETQIVKILNEVEGGRLVKDVCREHGFQMPRTTTGSPSTEAWKPLMLSD